jgi:hypothetical protein
MSKRRVRRIGLHEADRLVAGARPDPDMEGLAGLLDAARAPTPGEDLAGERAAVAGFLAARQRAVPTAPPRRPERERVRPLVRATAMKAALAIAVLAFGGTALAARTGSLPTAAQERAHDLLSGVGVPAPAQTTRSTQARPSATTSSAVPSKSPTPARTATPTPGGTAPAVELCRVWDAARQPPGKAVPAETRRALAAAAGGVPKIDDFCAGVLGKAGATPTATGAPATTQAPGPTATGKPTHSKKPKPTPTHPGKSKSKGKG